MKLSYLIMTPLLLTMLGCGSNGTESKYLEVNSLKNNIQNINIDLGESLDLNYNFDKNIKSYYWYDNEELISRDKSTTYTPQRLGKHIIKLYNYR